MTRVAALFCLLLASPALAGDLKILPADVTLTGPKASQRLLVVDTAANDVTAEVTASVTFTSSNDKVVKVESGVARPVSDGEATVTAKAGERAASVKVRVEKTRDAFDWSFRNHVMPVLTRAGCNSGACHGALAGKGGLKLSLRGYNLEADHFVLTRQAGGRRIDREAPEKSLMLLKPTMTLPHGGGVKLEVGGEDFRVVADWIAAGAPGPRENDTRIKRLEVLPPAAVLKPKDNVQLLVRAWYSDGRSEEAKHSMVLEDWLLKSGQRSDEQLADLHREVFSHVWQLPHDSARGMLCYAMFQELATQMHYVNLRAVARADGGCPALERVLTLVAADEAAHADFFVKLVAIYLDFDRAGTLEQLRRVANSFQMPAVHMLADSAQRQSEVRQLRIFDEGIWFNHVLEPALTRLGLTRHDLRRKARREVSPPSLSNEDRGSRIEDRGWKMDDRG